VVITLAPYILPIPAFPYSTNASLLQSYSFIKKQPSQNQTKKNQLGIYPRSTKQKDEYAK